MFRPRPRGAKRFAVRPRPLSAGRINRGPIRALLGALGIACLVTAGVVLAAPPTADFTISDPVPETDQGVTFTSSVTDPDAGDTVSYGWDFGDGGSSSAQNPSHSYSTPGVKTVTLTVTDSPGGESSGPIQKTLRVNARPNAVISCSPTTLAPNQATTCNAGASTDAEGAVSYAWDTNGDGFNDGSDPMEQFSFSTPGSRTIRVRVTDGDGATDIAQGTVTVSNASPTADFKWSPASPVVNQTVTFDGSASSDPEGHALTYAWALDGDGQFNDGNSQTVQRAFATGGSKTIQLRVMDPEGNSNTATKIVSITNRAPTANFSFAGANTVTPSVPEVNEQVNFASTSTDPDGNGTIAIFEWDINYNGTFVVDRVGSTMSDSFGSPGNHRVALRVTDSSGAASPVFERTVRVNAPPVASISILSTQPEPGQSRTVPLANQPFAYTARPLPALPGTAPAPGCPPIGASPAVAGSTDPDNASDGNSTEIAAYSWDLDNNGTFGDATGADALVASGLPAGTRSVRLRVTDSDGGTRETTQSFRVNAPPVAQFVAEPLTPIVDQEITFSSTSTDPDTADHAGALTYSWDLDNDGTFCETPERGAIVKWSFPTANMNPGHPVTLAVTDTGGVTRKVTRRIIVQNTVPSGRFGWSPTAALPGEAVTFDASASTATAGKQIQGYEWDFDYDPSSNQFDVDAVGMSVNHTFATAGVKGVAVRVRESGGGFATVWDQIPVNAPPNAAFSASPSAPFVNDAVTFSSSSADPDGPLARQEWDLDGDGQFDDAAGAVVLGKFKRRGTYHVGLRVVDSHGAVAVTTQLLPVRDRPLGLLHPRVIISGRLIGSLTEVTSLFVLAPKGSTVTASCTAPRASAAAAPCMKFVKRNLKKRKRLRIRTAERRRLGPGTKLKITVAKRGFLTSLITYTMRAGDEPRRTDRCLRPGAKRPKRCPEQ